MANNPQVRTDDGTSTIAFICTAPAHAHGVASAVTVHDGGWAFCPYDVLADGHRWESAGGMTLLAARLSARTHPSTA
jgi:hypothetical protein